MLWEVEAISDKTEFSRIIWIYMVIYNCDILLKDLLQVPVCEIMNQVACCLNTDFSQLLLSQICSISYS